MLDARITKRLAAAKGVSLHRGKVRIAFTLPGEHQQTKRSLGIDPTVKNIDFAEMKLAEIKMDILRGTFSWEKHFPNDPKSRAENPTLAEALQRFYLDIGHWRASSERIAHSKANRLNELLPGKYLRDLNEEALQRLRKRLLVTTSRRHVNLLMSVLQQVMTRAVRARVLDSNPFLYLEPLPKVTQAEHAETEVEVFTLAEAERLLAVIPYPAAANLVEFLFWTGIRPGEAAALKWEDVEPDRVEIRRTRTSQSGALQPTKTGLTRTLLLPKRAVDALRRQRLLTGSKEFVFCSGPRLCPFQTSEVIKHHHWVDWLDRAGLHYRKLYATRHTFASWMLLAGETETYVAQSMGHSSVQMIRQVYGHFIPKTSHKWTLDDPEKYDQLKSQT